jgi:hypothetical protein
MKARKAATSIPFLSQVKENVRYPSTVPYEMSAVLVDLLDFAARYLTMGGRLVYWLPTIVDEYSNEDVPQHPSMVLIANSEQNFGKWSRRLITMEKVKEYISPTTQNSTITSSCVNGVANSGSPDPVDDLANELGHTNFREKYFELKRQSDFISSTELAIPLSLELPPGGTQALVEKAIAELEDIVAEPLMN